MVTFEDAFIKFVGKVIVILLINKEDIFKVVSHIVILARLIEIFLKAPKNLPDHNLGAEVVELSLIHI